MTVQPSVIVLLAVIALGEVAFVVLGRRRGWFDFSSLNSTALTESHFISPFALAVYRVLACGYAMGVLVYTAVDGGGRGFQFYTLWSFTLLVGYFVCVMLLSLIRQRRPVTFELAVNDDSGGRLLLGDSPAGGMRRLAVVCWVLFHISAVNVLLVDTTLWGLLYPYAKKHASSAEVHDKLLNYSSFNVHAANLPMLMLDFWLGRLTIIPAFAIIAVVVPTVYGCFQWIYHACGGGWAYFFLDTSKKSAALW